MALASREEQRAADVWSSNCAVCGDGGELVCCDGCPAVVHPLCVGLDKVPDEEFFCPTCAREECAACGQARLHLESHVMCGDDRSGCERVFHLRCVALDAVPEDDWFCESCLDEKAAREMTAKEPAELGSRQGAVRTAISAFAKAVGTEARATAWLRARDAKVSFFRCQVQTQVRRVRLVSFSFLRRRKPFAHETHDVRSIVAHPASADRSLTATATPSLRFMRSWDPHKRIDPQLRPEKRRRNFERTIGDLVDGTNPRILSFVSRDPGLRRLVTRANYLIRTWSKGPVLTIAYGDYCGILRSVAVAILVKKALDQLPGNLSVDLVHLDLRSAFLQHFRHNKKRKLLDRPEYALLRNADN